MVIIYSESLKMEKILILLFILQHLEYLFQTDKVVSLHLPTLCRTLACWKEYIIGFLFWLQEPCFLARCSEMPSIRSLEKRLEISAYPECYDKTVDSILPQLHCSVSKSKFRLLPLKPWTFCSQGCWSSVLQICGLERKIGFLKCAGQQMNYI